MSSPLPPFRIPARPQLAALFFSGLLLLGGAGSTFGHGDVHESIVAVTAEIEKNPGQADLYIRRASLHRSHQDWPAALADFEQAQKLDPDQKMIELARGELLTEMARFDEATKLLEGFRDAFPQSPRAWSALGRLHAQQLQWGAAAEAYGKAVEFTQPPDPHLYLEQVQALRSAGKLEEAGKVLDAGIGKLGNLPVLVQPAVEVAVECKAWDRAVLLLDAAISSSVRKERWLMKKGEVLEKAGRPKEALTIYKQALSEFETLPPNRRAVAAMIAFEQGLRSSIQRAEQEPAVKSASSQP